MRWLLLMVGAIALHVYLLIGALAPSLLTGAPTIRFHNYSTDAAAWSWFVVSLAVSLYELARSCRRQYRYRRLIMGRRMRGARGSASKPPLEFHHP